MLLSTNSLFLVVGAIFLKNGATWTILNDGITNQTTNHKQYDLVGICASLFSYVGKYKL